MPQRISNAERANREEDSSRCYLRIPGKDFVLFYTRSLWQRRVPVRRKTVGKYSYVLEDFPLNPDKSQRNALE